MSSTIHYKFRSAKEYDSYRFEGSGIPVWQLKTEIIESKKLEKSTDFDLVITNAQTSADYTDDMQIIPRNTSVVVRRVPVAPGSVRSFNSTREARMLSSRTTAPVPVNAAPTGPLSAEDADIQNIIQQGSMKFDQQATANAQSAMQPGRRTMMTFRPKPTAPSLPPPPNYVCFRCGQKGHYINYCPTNSDTNFDKPRIKKTTGIPKSFLKPIEGDAAQARSADPSLSVMITAEGDAVVARPNEEEWKRLVETKSLGVPHDDPRLAQVPAELSCLNEHLLINPVLLPCCGAPYCEACARLLRVCGKCESSFDHAGLHIDTDLKMRVEAFLSGAEARPSQTIAAATNEALINVETRSEDSRSISSRTVPRSRDSTDLERDDRRHHSHDHSNKSSNHRERNQRGDRDRHHYRRRSRSRSRSRDRRRSSRRSRSRSPSPSYYRRRSYRRQ